MVSILVVARRVSFCLPLGKWGLSIPLTSAFLAKASVLVPTSAPRLYTDAGPNSLLTVVAPFLLVYVVNRGNERRRPFVLRWRSPRLTRLLRLPIIDIARIELDQGEPTGHGVVSLHVAHLVSRLFPLGKGTWPPVRNIRFVRVSLPTFFLSVGPLATIRSRLLTLFLVPAIVMHSTSLFRTMSPYPYRVRLSDCLDTFRHLVRILVRGSGLSGQVGILARLRFLAIIPRTVLFSVWIL